MNVEEGQAEMAKSSTWKPSEIERLSKERVQDNKIEDIILSMFLIK